MKNGFTLVELLLGITIAVMIFLTASSVMALLFRSDNSTKRIEHLEQTKNDLQVEFSNTIRWATNITFSQGSNTTLTLDNNVYSLQNDKILKNGNPLTPTSVVVKSFEIHDYSNSPEIKSLEININLESKSNSAIKDNLRIVVSQRKTVFEQE